MLNLREKIGALICPRIFGDRTGFGSFDFPEPARFLEDYPPASFIVVGGNLEATPKLLNWIRAELLPRPPLFAADLEQGLGQQIRGATVFPPMMALGAAGSLELARDLGAAIAEEAAGFGVRWLLGPVLDLARDPRNPVIGSRSLGDDPRRTAPLGLAFLEGVREGGGIATAKHFPGHGSTPVDSHESLPTLDFPLEWLERFDLLPFRAAVEAKVPSVMVGHLAVPALEPDPALPASLSPRVVEGYLRGRLGYDGVILTDALVMGGAKGDSDPDLLGLLALEAGCDLILMPGDPLATARKIEEAVVRGRLSEKRIDRSLRRLSRLRLSRDRSVVWDPPMDPVDRSLARKSLTLVDAKGAFQPLAPGEAVHLQVWREVREGEELPGTLRAEIGRRGFRLGTGGRSVLAVFSDNRAWRGRAGLSEAAEREILQALSRADRPVLLAFSSPYAVARFLKECAVLLSYGGCRTTVEAALDAVCGELRPQGTLPVRIP